MSRSSGSALGNARSGTPRLELELHLNLLPPVEMEVDGVHGHGHDDSGSSSPSSCVSSDGSPGSKSPMVIGACTRCLMYCMVAKKDYPTCVSCKQPCLVDLLQSSGADKKGGKHK